MTFALALLFTCASAAEPAATASSSSQDSSPRTEFLPLARSAARLAEQVQRDGDLTGLAIAIVHRDQVLLAEGFGVADVASKEPVTADTVFRVASLSKAFAGTVSAMLVREGALNWSSRVANYLPAFKLKDMHSADVLTVQDILSHRVGLPYNTHDRLLEADEPYPLLVAKLGNVDPICGAGECYAYQNIAFSLIGDVVFAVTGDFYSHQVEKRIFHPLGMYTATYGRDALEASASWARPHVRRGKHWRSVRPKQTYYRIPPAAGVNASVRDLSEWMIAQLGHRPEVLSPLLLADVQMPRVATPGETTGSAWRRERVDEAHYALGWRIYDYAGSRLVYHAGAVEGYRAMLGLLPEKDFGVVLLWNCETGVPAGLFATLLDRALGLPQKDWLELDRLRAIKARRYR